tara:strand:- start:8346 stop:8972 length:627 start_codon:yes stop_codon:yes gene_type:complete
LFGRPSAFTRILLEKTVGRHGGLESPRRRYYNEFKRVAIGGMKGPAPKVIVSNFVIKGDYRYRRPASSEGYTDVDRIYIQMHDGSDVFLTLNEKADSIVVTGVRKTMADSRPLVSLSSDGIGASTENAHETQYINISEGQPTDEPFDIAEWIFRFETAQLGSREAIVEGFQHIINNGIVWKLRGAYRRKAYELIESGQCTMPQGEEDK